MSYLLKEIVYSHTEIKSKYVDTDIKKWGLLQNCEITIQVLWYIIGTKSIPMHFTSMVSSWSERVDKLSSTKMT